MTTGQKIKALREKYELSQTELGRLLNKSQGTIAKYEKDTAEMDYATIRKFCDFADCSADYLLGRVDSPELVLKKAPLGGDVFQEYAINKDAPDLTDEDILTLKEIIKQHQSEQQK